MELRPRGEGQGGKTGQGQEAAGVGLTRNATDAEHERQSATPNADNAINAERDKASAHSSVLASQLPSKQSLPVILVTSKYHTRRTRLTWNYITAGRSQPIVRAASQDRFDPDHWWQTRRFILSGVKEYLGIVNYYAGFVV